jgi:hypothetical protein
MSKNMQTIDTSMAEMEEREQTSAPAEATIENQPQTLTANLRNPRSVPTPNTNPKLTVRS